MAQATQGNQQENVQNQNDNQQHTQSNQPKEHEKSLLAKLPIGALILALVAVLVIGGYYAFISGDDNSEQQRVEDLKQETDKLEQETQEELDESKAEINYAALQVELEAQLLAARNAIDANVVTEVIIQDLRNIRINMESLKDTAPSTLNARIDNITEKSAQLEGQLRNNQDDALKTIEDILDIIIQDIQE